LQSIKVKFRYVKGISQCWNYRGGDAVVDAHVSVIHGVEVSALSAHRCLPHCFFLSSTTGLSGNKTVSFGAKILDFYWHI